MPSSLKEREMRTYPANHYGQVPVITAQPQVELDIMAHDEKNLPCTAVFPGRIEKPTQCGNMSEDIMTFTPSDGSRKVQRPACRNPRCQKNIEEDVKKKLAHRFS